MKEIDNQEPVSSHKIQIPKERRGLALGRDELHLAEFPLAALSDRLRERKTLWFEDQIRDKRTGQTVRRKLTITGSAEYGLPTALDDDVILGLIQLTKFANNFTERSVGFSRYQLIELLGWQHDGKTYRRIEESLNRWVGVTLYYQNAWWDKANQSWVSEKFHILDNVTVYERDSSNRRRGRGPRLLSSFSWNKTIFQSFRSDNLKKLDLRLYFSLKLATSKRTYRFLDKRFYHRPHWQFDLRQFACEHVGLSRSYDNAQLRRKLQPAVEELERVGFLAPVSPKDRYACLRRGSWRVSFTRKVSAASGQPKQLPGADLIQDLTKRGVTLMTARKLVENHTPQKIQAKMQIFDELAGGRDRRVSRNPPGYLVRSIEDNYMFPKALPVRSSTVPQRRQAPSLPRIEQDQGPSKAEHAQIESYWNTLSEEQQAIISSEALAEAKPWVVKQYRRSAASNPNFAKNYLRIIVHEHIKRRRLVAA